MAYSLLSLFSRAEGEAPNECEGSVRRNPIKVSVIQSPLWAWNPAFFLLSVIFYFLLVFISHFSVLTSSLDISCHSRGTGIHLYVLSSIISYYFLIVHCPLPVQHHLGAVVNCPLYLTVIQRKQSFRRNPIYYLTV